MLASRRRLIIGSTKPLQLETQLLVAAMTVPPGTSRKILIDRLIRSLKASGVWANLDALYVMAAHDEQAARLNWINPGTWTLTATNSPTFTVDRGFEGDGVSAHLNWNVARSALPKATQNSTSLFVYENTEVNLSSYSLGLAGGTNIFRVVGRSSGALGVRVNSGTTLAPAVSSGIGLSAGDRPDASVRSAYRNGVLISGPLASASAASNAFNVTFLREVSTYSTRRVAAGGAGASLGDAGQLSLYNGIIPYLIAVGGN